MEKTCADNPSAGKNKASLRRHGVRYGKILVALFCLLITGFARAEAEKNMGTPSKFMRREHNQIYARIERLAQTPGKTGKAANDLLTIMRPHIFAEEENVLPELGVLKEVAFGGSTAGMTWVISRAEALEKDYPQMLSEHKAIFKAIDKLSQAAEVEADQAALDLAAQLKAHIQDEEEIVYPAAILVGKYVKAHAGT